MEGKYLPLYLIKSGDLDFDISVDNLIDMSKCTCSSCQLIESRCNFASDNSLIVKSIGAFGRAYLVFAEIEGIND